MQAFFEFEALIDVAGVLTDLSATKNDLPGTEEGTRTAPEGLNVGRSEWISVA